MAFCQGACNRKVSQRADRGTGPGAQNPTGISRPHRRWGSGPSNLLDGGGGGRDCDDQSASSLQALGRRRPQESDYAADSRPGIWDGLACRPQGQYGRPCGHHHHQAWASRVRPATWCHYDQRPLAHGLGGSRVYAQDMDRYPAQPCRILADTHGSLVRWELLQGPQESYCAGRPPSGPRAPDQDQRVVLPGAPEAQGVHSHHLHMRRRCRILGQPPPARNPWRTQAKAPRSTTHTSYTTPPTFTIQMCTFPGVLPGWPQQARGRGESDLLARPNLPVEGSNTQNTHAHTRRNSSS